MGVEYIFSHHYSEYLEDDGAIRRYDTLKQIIDAGTSMKVGITSDDFEEAKDAVKSGADWMIFGVALRKPNVQSCREWINMLHESR